jgi:arylsulfatase
VCAPSRAVLLTGLHTGHAYIRDNDEMGDRGDVWRDLSLEGQRPLPAGTVTIASVLKRAGYATAAIGKWGLGGPGSTGEPNRLGFDLFFGFLCQRIAHNHYPPYLWRNRTAGFMARSRGEIVPPDAGHETVAMKVPLDNSGIYPHEKLPADKDPNALSSYERYGGQQYALDVMGEEARAFVRDYLYWEFQGRQAVRLGAWKGIRNALNGDFELYDLATDVGEQRNVASSHAGIVSRIETIMRTARTESALFPLVKR